MARSNWLKRLIWQPLAVGHDLGPLLARVAVGTLFLSSGWIKLHKLGEFSAYFADLGIPAPQFMGRLVAGSELVCGALLLLGAFTRLATIPLIVIMVVALATALRDKVTDFVALWSLPEALYILLLVWVGLVGAGKLSVDHFVRSRQRRKEEPVQPARGVPSSNPPRFD